MTFAMQVLDGHSPRRGRRGSLPRRARNSGARHGHEGAQSVPLVLFSNEQVRWMTAGRWDGRRKMRHDGLPEIGCHVEVEQT